MALISILRRLAHQESVAGDDREAQRQFRRLTDALGAGAKSRVPEAAQDDGVDEDADAPDSALVARSPEEELAFARQAGDRGAEAWALVKLGSRFDRVKQPSKGIAYLEAGLEMHRELGDPYGESTALHVLT